MPNECNFHIKKADQITNAFSEECFRRMTSDKATDSRVDKHPKRKVTDVHL